jgi:succinate-semialdehyde dehydrogenase / glutarate-semialdehyde dehydrogenase
VLNQAALPALSNKEPVAKRLMLIRVSQRAIQRGVRASSTFPVLNPSTGQLIQHVKDCSVADAQQMVARAVAEQERFKNMLAADRERALMAIHSLFKAHTEELAQLISAEAGKPLLEARGEVTYAAGYMRWFAGEARRAYGHTIPTTHPNRRLWTVAQPIGVSAMITPWNFPLAMAARKLAAAIAAGCVSIVKPAEDTPLTALRMQELILQAGLAEDVVQVLTCSRERVEEVCSVLTRSPDVRKVSFTGSSAVGKHIAEASASTVKRLSLELGGNAPVIVFDDADLRRAVDATVASRFRNAGQTCVCANRIYVHERVHDEFVAMLLNKISNLVIGPGQFYEPLGSSFSAVDIGPLINQRAVDKANRLVHDAVERGGRLLIGGRQVRGLTPRRVGSPDRDGPVDASAGTAFFEPTLLVDVAPDSACVVEESFAPIAPVVKFSTEAQALQMANSSRSGLAGYVFTRDLGRALRVSEALEVGMVGVNEGVISTEVAPFGGIKESGFGKEGGAEGLSDYMVVKYVAASW